MDQKNLVIAIALSIAILLGFQFSSRSASAARSGGAGANRPSKPTPAGAPASGGSPSAAPGAAAPSLPSAAGSVPAAESRDVALGKSPRVRINTPQLHGSIALVGGRIDDLTLAQYHETVDPKSPEIVLLSPPGAASPYFVDLGWAPADKGVAVPGEDTRWTAAGGELTASNPVTLTWDKRRGAPLHPRDRRRRPIHVHGEADRREYRSGPVTLYPYSSVTRLGTPPSSTYYILFEGMIGDFNGTLKEIKYSGLKEGDPVSESSTGTWLGFTDKYWLTALVPPQDQTVKGHFTHTLIDRTDRYQADFLDGEKIVAPGGTAETSSRLFAGPKVVKLLDRYRDQFGVTRFDDAVDWGWFWFLTKPIFMALDFFYGVIVISASRSCC